MVFRTLEGEPVVPSWLRANSQRVLPAPFNPSNEQDPAQDAQQTLPLETEPEPFPNRLPMPSVAPTPRRSSLPPRMSGPPPQVVITRPPRLPSEPPPPPPPAAPAVASPEQQEFALATLELGSLRARVLGHAETQILELAVAIAEAIIEREVERDPSIHETFAKAAVSVLGDTSNAKLRVSRAAHKAISELHGEPAVDVDGVRVELTLDNSLDGLSVVAESGASHVDGRISERLGAVLRAIEADQRRRDAGEGE